MKATMHPRCRVAVLGIWSQSRTGPPLLSSFRSWEVSSLLRACEAPPITQACLGITPGHREVQAPQAWQLSQGRLRATPRPPVRERGAALPWGSRDQAPTPGFPALGPSGCR